jgi:hypothetical protein
LETYIALLLLVVPGFISYNIYEKLNHDRKVDNQLELTIKAMIYNIFILFANCLSMLIGRIFTVDTMMYRIKNLVFILLYAVITLLNSIIVAFAWNWFKPKVIDFLNRKRKNEGKNSFSDAETVWANKFNDGKLHGVLIERDGKEIAKGVIKSISDSDGKSKELYLILIDFLDKRPECFDKRKGVYFDLDTNTKITEYDISKLQQDSEKAIKNEKICRKGNVIQIT